MRREPFGGTGVRVSVVGQGTWRMEADAASSIRALRRGIGLGMTHIDTAEMYGSGRVEEIVGKAIAGRRDEVFLVSKVLPSNASFAGTVEACERSLGRLRTDRLDLYLLHWRGEHPLGETFRGFERLEHEGKIRAWGVSNFDAPDLDQARVAAGSMRIACNQVLYHVRERAIEHAVIPWCEAHGVAIVAYSPFAEGELPAPSTAGGRALAEVARRRGATAWQVALGFLLRRPGIFAIPKASHLEHVEENAAAGELVLTDDEVAILDRALPRGNPKPLPMI